MNTSTELCEWVKEDGESIHAYHGHGHGNAIYESALAHRLRKKGLTVDQHFPVNVYDEDGTLLGEYHADLYVEKSLIVEIRTCRSLSDEYAAQLLGAMRSSRTEHGVLLNFGAPRFQMSKYALRSQRRIFSNLKCSPAFLF